MTTKAGTKTTSSPNHFWKIVKNDFRHCGRSIVCIDFPKKIITVNAFGSLGHILKALNDGCIL